MSGNVGGNRFDPDSDDFEFKVSGAGDQDQEEVKSSTVGGHTFRSKPITDKAAQVAGETFRSYPSEAETLNGGRVIVATDNRKEYGPSEDLTDESIDKCLSILYEDPNAKIVVEDKKIQVVGRHRGLGVAGSSEKAKNTVKSLIKHCDSFQLERFFRTPWGKALAENKEIRDFFCGIESLQQRGKKIPFVVLKNIADSESEWKALACEKLAFVYTQGIRDDKSGEFFEKPNLDLALEYVNKAKEEGRVANEKVENSDAVHLIPEGIQLAASRSKAVDPLIKSINVLQKMQKTLQEVPAPKSYFKLLHLLKSEGVYDTNFVNKSNPLPAIFGSLFNLGFSEGMALMFLLRIEGGEQVESAYSSFFDTVEKFWDGDKSKAHLVLQGLIEAVQRGEDSSLEGIEILDKGKLNSAEFVAARTINEEHFNRYEEVLNYIEENSKLPKAENELRATKDVDTHNEQTINRINTFKERSTLIEEKYPDIFGVVDKLKDLKENQKIVFSTQISENGLLRIQAEAQERGAAGEVGASNKSQHSMAQYFAYVAALSETDSEVAAGLVDLLNQSAWGKAILQRPEHKKEAQQIINKYLSTVKPNETSELKNRLLSLVGLSSPSLKELHRLLQNPSILDKHQQSLKRSLYEATENLFDDKMGEFKLTLKKNQKDELVFECVPREKGFINRILNYFRNWAENKATMSVAFQLLNAELKTYPKKAGDQFAALQRSGWGKRVLSQSENRLKRLLFVRDFFNEARAQGKLDETKGLRKAFLPLLRLRANLGIHWDEEKDAKACYLLGCELRESGVDDLESIQYFYEAQENPNKNLDKSQNMDLSAQLDKYENDPNQLAVPSAHSLLKNLLKLKKGQSLVIASKGKVRAFDVVKGGMNEPEAGAFALKVIADMQSKNAQVGMDLLKRFESSDYGKAVFKDPSYREAADSVIKSCFIQAGDFSDEERAAHLESLYDVANRGDLEAAYLFAFELARGTKELSKTDFNIEDLRSFVVDDGLISQMNKKFPETDANRKDFTEYEKKLNRIREDLKEIKQISEEPPFDAYDRYENNERILPLLEKALNLGDESLIPLHTLLTWNGIGSIATYFAKWCVANKVTDDHDKRIDNFIASKIEAKVEDGLEDHAREIKQSIRLLAESDKIEEAHGILTTQLQELLREGREQFGAPPISMLEGMSADKIIEGFEVDMTRVGIHFTIQEANKNSGKGALSLSSMSDPNRVHFKANYVESFDDYFKEAEDKWKNLAKLAVTQIPGAYVTAFTPTIGQLGVGNRLQMLNDDFNYRYGGNARVNVEVSVNRDDRGEIIALDVQYKKTTSVNVMMTDDKGNEHRFRTSLGNVVQEVNYTWNFDDNMPELENVKAIVNSTKFEFQLNDVEGILSDFNSCENLIHEYGDSSPFDFYDHKSDLDKEIVEMAMRLKGGEKLRSLYTLLTFDSEKPLSDQKEFVDLCIESGANAEDDDKIFDFLFKTALNNDVDLSPKSDGIKKLKEQARQIKSEIRKLLRAEAEQVVKFNDIASKQLNKQLQVLAKTKGSSLEEHLMLDSSEKVDRQFNRDLPQLGNFEIEGNIITMTSGMGGGNNPDFYNHFLDSFEEEWKVLAKAAVTQSGMNYLVEPMVRVGALVMEEMPRISVRGQDFGYRREQGRENRKIQLIINKSNDGIQSLDVEIEMTDDLVLAEEETLEKVTELGKLRSVLKYKMMIKNGKPTVSDITNSYDFDPDDAYAVTDRVLEYLNG
ncbi:MAG: hypothetical protein WD595_03260 [Waddliaceae bacterium]